MQIAQFQSLWADLDPALKEFREEAATLRDSVSSPEQADTPETTHARLIAARRAQDRLEQILADVGLFRSRVRKLVIDLDEAYEDAWTNAMMNSRIGEYTSAKERDATYSVAAVQEKINLRKAKKILADIEEVYDFIYVKNRGLDAVRNDAKTTLRYGEFEAHYER